MSNDRVLIFVLGGPGAGKGTQCKIMTETYGFLHVSVGDLLREEQERIGSEYADLIKSRIENGQLVPGEIPLKLLKSKIENTSGRVMLIDGFPRDLEQAKEFEKEIGECDFVLMYECDPKTMVARLGLRSEYSGRIDDNPEAIEKRFVTYQQATRHVIDHYSQKGKLIKIPCEGTIEEVSECTHRILIDKKVISNPQCPV